MIVLYCLLALAALIILLLLTPVRVRLRVDETGGLTVRVHTAHIPIFRHPAKQKAPKIKDYSPRAIKKRQKKQARKQARLQKKQTAKKAAFAHAASRGKRTLAQKVQKLTDTLSLITSLIDALHEKAFRAAHVHLYALQLRIGTGDAARTALLYGVICPAASALLQAIHQCSNLHVHHPKRMCVQPDFVNDTFHVEIDIALQLRVHHLLSLGLGALIHIIKHKQSISHRKSPAALSASVPPKERGTANV